MNLGALGNFWKLGGKKDPPLTIHTSHSTASDPPNVVGRSREPFSIQDLTVAFKQQFGGCELRNPQMRGELECVGSVPDLFIAAVCKQPLRVGKAQITWESYAEPKLEPNLFGYCAGEVPKVPALVAAFKTEFGGLELQQPFVWEKANKAFCSGYVSPALLEGVLAKKTLVIGGTTISWKPYKSLFTPSTVPKKVESANNALTPTPRNSATPKGEETKLAPKSKPSTGSSEFAQTDTLDSPIPHQRFVRRLRESTTTSTTTSTTSTTTSSKTKTPPTPREHHAVLTVDSLMDPTEQKIVQEEHVLRLSTNLELDAAKVHQTLARFLEIDQNSFPPFQFRKRPGSTTYEADVYLPSAEILTLAKKFHYNKQLTSKAKVKKPMREEEGVKLPKVKEVENMTIELPSYAVLKCFTKHWRTHPELHVVKCKSLPADQPSLNVSGPDLLTVETAIEFARSVIGNYKQGKYKIDSRLCDLLWCCRLEVIGVEYELPSRKFKNMEEKEPLEDNEDEESVKGDPDVEDEENIVGPVGAEKREIKETVEVTVCAISETSLQEFASQLRSLNVVEKEIPLSGVQNRCFVRFAPVVAATTGPVNLSNLAKDAKKADLARELGNLLKCEVTQSNLQLNVPKKILTLSALAPSGRKRLLAKGFFLTKQGTMLVRGRNSIITSDLEKKFKVSINVERNRVCILAFDELSVDSVVAAIKESLLHAKRLIKLNKYQAAFAETDQAKEFVKTLAKQHDVAIETHPFPTPKYVISGTFVANVVLAREELQKKLKTVLNSSVYDLTSVSNRGSLVKWLLRKNVGTVWNSQQTTLELVTVDENTLKSVSKELSDQIAKQSAPTQQQGTPKWLRIPESELKIEEMIGEGGSATVYRGIWMRPASTQRPAQTEKVAIKVFKNSSEAENVSFLRELEVMSDLPHPNILQIYGVCETNPPKIICEFMPDDLDTLIRKKRVSIQKGLRFLRDIAAGMAHLHRYHVAHRDLKPKNILIAGGQAKVSDFGSSKDINQTVQNTTVGTFLFIAPEVNMGKPSGLPADVYSFGVTMYQILSGTLPNPRAQTASLVEDLGRLDIPKRVVDLFSQCNADDPADRPSMEQLREALEVIVEIHDQGQEKMRIQLIVACNQDLQVYNDIWQTHYEGQHGTMELLQCVRRMTSQTFPLVYQACRDQSSLEAAAKSANGQIHAALRSVVIANGGKYEQGPLKSPDRLRDKAHGDYQGDFSRVLDVVRGTGLFQKSLELLACLESLEKDNEVELVRVKDRFNSPEQFGYRDILLNVRHRKSKFIAELLLTFEEIFNYKSQSHRIYDLHRVL